MSFTIIMNNARHKTSREAMLTCPEYSPSGLRHTMLSSFRRQSAPYVVLLTYYKWPPAPAHGPFLESTFSVWPHDHILISNSASCFMWPGACAFHDCIQSVTQAKALTLCCEFAVGLQRPTSFMHRGASYPIASVFSAYGICSSGAASLFGHRHQK